MKGINQRAYNYKLIRRRGRLVFEHRYKMEKLLGRKLNDEEFVHHINRNKKDNRIENLKVVTRKEHGKEHSHL